MNTPAKKINTGPKPSDTAALDAYKKSNAKKVLLILLIAGAIVILSMVTVVIGPLDITVKEVYQIIAHKIAPALVASPGEIMENAVWYVRIPRLLTGLLVGSSLATAGAVMQPVLRNPMASPFTLGISSGAGFGAALAIIVGASIGSGTYFVVANAFVFSLITSVVIMMISKRKGATPEMMILTGIALSYFFSAATTLMEYFADSWAVNQVVFWMVGSLAKGTWDTLKFIFPAFLICVPYMIYKSWDLNSIGAGDDAARSLGVNVIRTRISLMIIASFLTASTICFTGAIGFIGLVAPHITRMLIGGDNRFVVPVSGLFGALLLAGSDLVAVNIISPVVIPIGIMTSFMGVPLFIYLIQKMKRGNF